jgi:OTU domain-containing protein 6
VDAEWGGHIEIQAISASLRKAIFVYSADAPTIKMGEQFLDINGDDTTGYGTSLSPLRLTYHKHYYALGEHYNSAVALSS